MIRVRAKKNLVSRHTQFQLDIDLEFPATEIVTLFGHSGAGKTTILRMIAGLTQPDEGYIEVDGDVWFDSARNINKPVQDRNIGFVFQDYNLFPNMTVRENLHYALRNQEDDGLIEKFLEMTHLTDLRDHMPDMLSGGQKQRVALVRALMSKPKLFLLDEPFSALDQELRVTLQDEFLSLQQRFNVPAIFVSHDPGEVFKLSHRVFLINNGKILRYGSAQDVFYKNEADDTIILSGNILSTQKEDSECSALVRIGKDIVKITIPPGREEEWRAGSSISISVHANRSTDISIPHPYPTAGK